MGITKKYLEDFSKLAGGKTAEYYSWILENGVLFTGAEIIGKPKFPVIQKACFNNSLKGCYLGGLEYWEGFYVTEIGFPLEHAWNVKDGKVVDLTSQKFNFSVSERFGVQIPPKILAEYISSGNTFLTPLSYYFRKITNGKNRDNL